MPSSQQKNATEQIAWGMDAEGHAVHIGQVRRGRACGCVCIDCGCAFNAFFTGYQTKYPKAANFLINDCTELLTFYDLPGAHWQSIRTTNPIESTFASVRLRTAKTRGCISHDMLLGLTFKLGQSAAKRLRRLRDYQWIEKLEQGVTLIDGIEQTGESDNRRSAA